MTAAAQTTNPATGLYVAFGLTLLVALALGAALFRRPSAAAPTTNLHDGMPRDNVLLLDEPVLQR